MWWKRQGARELRAILNDWDPIGVYQIDRDWPRDEYDAYMGPIVAQLRTVPDADAVAALLARFRTQNMAQGARDEDDRAVAESIVVWYLAAMSGAPYGDIETPRH